MDIQNVTGRASSRSDMLIKLQALTKSNKKRSIELNKLQREKLKGDDKMKLFPILLWFRDPNLENEFLDFFYLKPNFFSRPLFVRLPLGSLIVAMVFTTIGIIADENTVWTLPDFIISILHFILSIIGIIPIIFIIVHHMNKRYYNLIKLYELLCLFICIFDLLVVIARDTYYDYINGILLIKFGFVLVFRLRLFWMALAFFISWIFHTIFRFVDPFLFREWGESEMKLRFKFVPYYLLLYTVQSLLFFVFAFVIEKNERKSFVHEKTLDKLREEILFECKNTELLLKNVIPQKYLKEVRKQHVKFLLKKAHDINVEQEILFLIDHLKNAAVVVTDLVNFNSWCSTKTCADIVIVLNEHFKYLDIFSQFLDIRKVKTAGHFLLFFIYYASAGDSFIGYAPSKDEEVSCSLVDKLFTFGFAAILSVKKQMSRTCDGFICFINDAMKLRVGIGYGDLDCVFFKRKFLSFELFGQSFEDALGNERAALPNHICVPKEFKTLVGDKYLLDEMNMINCDRKIQKVCKDEVVLDNVTMMVDRGFENTFKEVREKRRIMKKQEKLESDSVQSSARSVISRSISEIFLSQRFKAKKIDLDEISQVELVESQSGWIIPRLFKTRNGLCLFPIMFVSKKMEWEYLKHIFERSKVFHFLPHVFQLVFNLTLILYYPSYGDVNRLGELISPYFLYLSIVVHCLLLLCVTLNDFILKNLVVDGIISTLSIISSFPYLITFNSYVRNPYFELDVFHVEHITYVGMVSMLCHELSTLQVNLKLFLLFFYVVSYCVFLLVKYEWNFLDPFYYNNLTDIVVVTSGMVLQTIYLEFVSRNSFEKEMKIKKRTLMLLEEIDFNVTLLTTIIPQEVLPRLSIEKLVYDSFENTLVCCLRVDKLPQNMTGVNIQYIIRIFSEFDEIVTETNCTKVKCLNEDYLFMRNLKGYGDISQLAFDELMNTVRKCIHIFEIFKDSQKCIVQDCELKIGVAYGSVSAGIFGYRKLIWDIVGCAVNKASKLAYFSRRPNFVHVIKDSEMTHFIPEYSSDLEIIEEKESIRLGRGNERNCESQYLNFTASNNGSGEVRMIEDFFKRNSMWNLPKE